MEIRRRLVAAAAALLTSIPVVLVATANAAVPPAPPGWSLAWSDDFNGANGSLPSSANWIIDLGTRTPAGPATGARARSRTTPTAPTT